MKLHVFLVFFPNIREHYDNYESWNPGRIFLPIEELPPHPSTQIMYNLHNLTAWWNSWKVVLNLPPPKVPHPETRPIANIN